MNRHYWEILNSVRLIEYKIVGCLCQQIPTTGEYALSCQSKKLLPLTDLVSDLSPVCSIQCGDWYALVVKEFGDRGNLPENYCRLFTHSTIKQGEKEIMSSFLFYSPLLFRYCVIS
jgi:hypothetical protein